MACVVIEGLIALVLVIAGLREAIMRAVPHEIKLSIGVGIGLFIALVGLPRRRASRSTTRRPGSGSASSPAGAPLVALGGLLVMIVLTARGVRGAILLGILASTALGPDLRRARRPGQGRADPELRTTSRRSATRSAPTTSPTR